MSPGSTSYTNSLWFNLLPWKIKQKIMASNYRKRMALARAARIPD